MQSSCCARRPAIALAIVLMFSAIATAGSRPVLPSQPIVISTPTQAPPRDRMPAPRVGTGAVKGRVVDGTTGAGIARARIMMQGMGAGATVLTDADGGFAFTGLPAGPVMFTVQKSTYLPGRYPSGGRSMRTTIRPITLRDGQVLDNVTVPLFHGASISGRVFDANGDPIDYAQVSVLRLPAGGRSGKPMMRDGTQTNDLGEFRIGRLEAGTYVVQVIARRMDSEAMFSSIPPPAAPTAPTAPTAQPLPTFYPGALAIDQAQPIVVERSQAVSGVDVILAEGMPGVVTGTVVMANGQPLPPNTFPSVMLRRVISADNPNSFDYMSSGAMTRPDGTFRATLAPGDYYVEARVVPRTNGPTNPEDEQSGSTRVSVVAGGEESLTIAVGRGASARGRVVFEGDTPAPPSPGKIRVPMYSENGMCRGGEAVVAPDWSFRVEGLVGTCSAQPVGTFGRWMLKAVVVNGENLVDSPVTFQPGQQLRNVQVVVTDRRSGMSFQVSDENGQTTREYVVVAYPVERARWPQAARTFIGPTIQPPDGGRSLSGVPGQLTIPPRPQALSGLRPGEYYVVAVDDMEPEDPGDTAVLDRLRSSATRVTVTEGATVEVSLRRVNFSDVMRRN